MVQRFDALNYFSVSLSSMESEGDEPSFIDNVDGSAVKLLDTNAAVGTKHRNTRTAGGANSTHSLNEADLKVTIQ